MTRGDLALYLGSFLPFFLVLFGGTFLFRRRARKHLLSEKMLRPPGYSLKARLDEALDDYNTLGLAMLGIPLVVIVTSKPLQISSSALAMSLAGYGVFLGVVGVIHLRKMHRLRLGLDGELIVAEFLNDLRADGYFIFHDLPTPYGNIDHVVLGPSGVFAVETKARRKGTVKGGHTVIYEKGALHFPTGRNVSMIEQAQRQGEWLQRHLSKGGIQKIEVVPMLALPGWFVEMRSPSPFPIVNPKQISRVVRQQRKHLSDQTIAALRYDIEQSVRDVTV